jgi:hypothetical protein
MKMTIEVSEVTGPAFMASALVNGDTSGLNADDLAAYNAFVEGLRDWRVVDVARDKEGNGIDPRFTWLFRMYGGNAEGGDVIGYVVHRSK